MIRATTKSMKGGKEVMSYVGTITEGDLPSFLTVQEVSELLHIHTNTVRRWSDSGVLRANRIGPRGDRRFRRKDIVQFVAEFDPYKTPYQGEHVDQKWS